MMEHTGFHDKEHFSPDCPKCRQVASLVPPWLIEYEKEQNGKLNRPGREKIRGQIAMMIYAGLGVYPDGGKSYKIADQIIALFPDVEDELKVVGMIRKQERERIGIELKKEIDIKRTNAFSVSLFGDREHQIKMDAMVNAYDVALNLIKDIGGK